MKLSIFSPERKLLASLDVVSVTLTTTEGQVQVLEGHAPMMGMLETGMLSYTLSGGTETHAAVSAGFFEVTENRIALTAETMEFGTEVDLSRAKTAQEKAEQTLRDAALDEHGFKKYQLKLQRSLIRQQVAGKI